MPDYHRGLDRDGIVRGRRRAQALDALEFERERERALVEQIESLVVETEGARIDAEVFARLDPADVALVRDVLAAEYSVGEEEDEEFSEEEGYVDLEGSDDDAGDDTEDEIARLEGVIETSRALQAALQRYVAVLDAGQG